MTTLNTLTLNAKTFVLVEKRQYDRMVKALTGQPSARANALRQPGDADALTFADASIGRTIARRRKQAGLTQKQLAQRANIRVETLNRAERGVTSPDLRTLQKIEKILVSAGA